MNCSIKNCRIKRQLYLREENYSRIIGENDTICKGRSCVDGEERTDMPNCPGEGDCRI